MSKKLNFFLLILLLMTPFFQSCSNNFDHKSPYDPDSPPYMQLPATLEGSVTLENEKDCSGVSINVTGKNFTTSISTYRKVTTTTVCNFKITGIYPGIYSISISTRYYIPVVFKNIELPIGKDVNLGEINLNLIRVKLTGSVKLRGENSEFVSPAGTLITLKRVGSIRKIKSMSVASVFKRMSSATTTDSVTFTTVAGTDGEFTLEDVPAGVYNVVAEREGYAPGVIQGIAVGENENTHQNIGTISLRKVTGDFEIIGYLAPISVSSPTKSNEYTATRNVTLNLYGFNAVQMMIVNGSNRGECDFSRGTWEEFEAVKDWTLSEGDGKKYVCVKFRDLSGKESKVLKSSIVLDTVPPVIYRFSPIDSEFLTFVEGAYYWRGGDSIPFEFSIYDETSGVEGFYIEEDGNPLWNKEKVGNWPSFRNYYSILITSEGAHQIYGCFSDFAHNVTCVSEPIEVVKDTHKPEVQLFLYTTGITNSPDVSYHLVADDGNNDTSQLMMKISDRDDFAGVNWQPFRENGTFHFSEGGKVWLYAKVRDRAGNESGVVSRSITIDLTPPQNIHFSPVNLNVNTTTPYFNISAEGADKFRICETSSFSGTGCDWRNYTGATSVQADITDREGWHTLYIQFSDEAGNLSSIYSTQVYYDPVPPTADLIEIEEENQYGFVNTTSLNLKLLATGASYMMVTGDVVGEGKWRNYTASYDVFLTPGDGEKNICVKFKDLAGNISNVLCKHTILDTLPPVINPPFVTVEGGNLTNHRSIILHFYLNSLEDPSQVQMEVSQHGSFYDASWRRYSSEITWSLDGDDGEKEIFVRFRDLAGNLTPGGTGYYSVKVTLDTTPPDFKVLVAKFPFSNSVTVPVILSAEDNISQLLYVSFAEDDSLLGLNWELYSRNMTFQIGDDEGEHKIYAVVRDQAGNFSVVKYTTVVYDNTPPAQGFVIINNGDDFSTDPEGKLKLSLSSFDAVSGLAFMEISETPDFSTATPIPFSPTYNYVINSPGPGQERLVTIYVRYADRAGNWSKPVTDTIYYDTKPPIAGWVKVNDGDFWTSSRDVILDYSVTGARFIEISESSDFSDASWLPLVAHPHYRISTSAEGPVRIYVRFRDEAGNISGVVYDDICLDLTPPDSPVVKITSGHNGYTNREVLYLKANAAFSPACVTSDAPMVRFSTSPDFSDGTGWVQFDENETYSLGITSESDGEITVFAQFADQAGQLSEVATDNIIKDTIPPSNCSIGVVSGNLFDGIRYVNSHTVVLRLTADDPSPVTFVVSNVYPPTGNAQSLVNYYTHILAPGDGQKYVYARFYDMAGNYTDVVTGNVILDTVPPSIPPLISQNVIVNTNNYTVQRGNVTVDPNFLRWECQGGTNDSFVPCGYSQSLTLFTYTLKTGTPQFINTLRLRAVDKAGNVGNSAILQVTYDATPPTKPLLSHRSSRVYVNKDIYLVEVTTPSNDVNFDRYQYCINYGDVVSCPESWYVDSSLSLEIPIPLQDNTLITVFVRGKDKAGNVSKPDRIVIEEDSEPPTAPSFVVDETYANALSMPIYLAQPSEDPSLADPGEDNLDHYEIYGGVDCKTGRHYVNYNIGVKKGINVCLFNKDNGVLQLRNDSVEIQIVAVDKAGNKSYPAVLNIHNKFSQDLFEFGNREVTFIPTWSGIFADDLDGNILYKKYGWNKVYSLNVVDELKKCTLINSFNDMYVDAVAGDGKKSFDIINNFINDALVEVYLDADSQLQMKYLFPLMGPDHSIDADNNGLVWADVNRGIYFSNSVTPEENFQFTGGNCFFNAYEVTRETWIYGFYQLIDGSFDSSEKFYGIYGSYQDSSIDIDEIVDLGKLGYNLSPPNNMILVPVKKKVYSGDVFVLGVCLGDSSASGDYLKGKEITSGELPKTMFDTKLIGSSVTYNPVVTPGVNSISNVSLDSSRAYSQILLSAKDKVLRKVEIYYLKKKLLDDGMYYDYPYPISPADIQVIDEKPYRVAGYEELFYDANTWYGNDRVRGVKIKFNGDYTINAIRAYLECSGSSQVVGLLYTVNSDGTYSLAVSSSWLSTSLGFKEYILNIPSYNVEKDKEYVIAVQWKGDNCNYKGESVSSLPIKRPYGEIEYGVYYNGITEPTLNLNTTYNLYQIGFDIYQNESDESFKVKLSGRYIAVNYSENELSFNPVTSGVEVYDLGENLRYDPGVDSKCSFDVNSNYEYDYGGISVGLLSGILTDNFIDKGTGELNFAIHDFGNDKIPCTSDDREIYSQVPDFVVNSLLPSLKGFFSSNYIVSSGRVVFDWYKKDQIYDYGNNWVDNISPAKRGILEGWSMDFNEDQQVYKDIFYNLKSGTSETKIVSRISAELFYPFTATGFQNGLIISSSNKYIAIRGYEFYNNNIKNSYGYLIDATNGNLLRKLKFSDRRIDILTLAGQYGFIVSNFYDYSGGTPEVEFININTGSIFYPSNITINYQVSDYMDGAFLFNVIHPDGTKFLFAEEDGSVYHIHIYDLGPDGLHIDEGSSDDREDWIAPFPIEVTQPVLGFYLKGNHFAYLLSTGEDFNFVLEYGELGTSTIHRITNVEKFLGIADNYLIFKKESYEYAESQFVTLRDLTTGEEKKIYLPSPFNLVDFNVGNYGEWIIVVDMSRQFWALNPRTMESFLITAGNTVYSSLDSSYGVHVADSGIGYFLGVEKGRRLLFRMEPGR